MALSDTDTETENRICENLQQIRQQIAAACERAGRDPHSVQLVAVTKYADWRWIELLSRHHAVFGENRPQQLADRQRLLPQIEWHLIGQLQRNKVRLALEHAALIHSVDSLRLLERIAVVAEELSRKPRLLLQVNVSGEASKSGFSPEELRGYWPRVLEMMSGSRGAAAIQIDGLMTMAPESDDPEDARPCFRLLCDLRNELATAPDSQALGMTLPLLSMGMSGDYVPAVEEGATLVRIGSRIFEGLESEAK